LAANEELARVMIEAGFLDRAGTIGRKRFARAVTDAATDCAPGRNYTHTYVSRWLDGVTPRDSPTREAIREALSRRLGRRVAIDELGFDAESTVNPDVGLGYPTDPEHGITHVAELLRADAADVAAIVESSYNVAAWNESSIAWLVGEQRRPTSSEGPARVGASDVRRLRAMRDSFDRIDNTFGGAHARQALVRYLSGELPRLLRAGASPEVRRTLFAAAGEATQLAAWMAYDSGLHGLSQRYFVQALGFADAADDSDLGASVLDAMSHQASFLGRHREAANMARAASLGTKRTSAPLLSAHFDMMEARALARAGDTSECDRAMNSAIAHFERRDAEDGPPWISYFDTAEFYAELAHCHRDLGRPDRAIEYATYALGSASGDYARSDFFVALVLADAHLDRGDIEEGCDVARKALSVSEGLDSVRCRTYVSEFKLRLQRHEKSPEASKLIEAVRGAQLWTGAA
jgi:tetratricopeptide (TPR) repeat protein